MYPIKMTVQVRLVLGLFNKDPDEEMYGREVGRKVDLPPGTVFPILERLEGVGWLVSRWEDPSERQTGARRHYYRLTSDGWAVARREVREANYA